MMGVDRGELPDIGRVRVRDRGEVAPNLWTTQGLI